METSKFGVSDLSIPLTVKVYKQCVEGWGCGLHNYIEVHYNSNHQILLEGEYIQKEELDSMIPKYYNDNQTLYDLVPRKTFISIQWDLSVEEDSLSSLFGAIIDGYFKSANLYSLNRYKTDICNLTNDQLDSLKKDFPFNLELPSYELVIPPVPVQLTKIEEKWDCSANDFLSLKNEKVSNQLFFKLDSIRSYQYPNNDQEVNISVDLTKEYLNKFLADIDKDILSKTGRYENEYHFNIAPKGYTDPKKCMDKISVEFSSTDCSYRMVIYNTFLVEPDWCTESAVIYSFKIKNKTIVDFYRNEAG